MMSYKRSSTPKSAAIIGGNDDLLMEILSFVPAKPLIRFQLVSKHWQSLIFAPSFSRLHTLRHRNRPKPQPIVLLRSTRSQFFYCNPTIRKLIPYNFGFAYMKIMQSCNGLLLLECSYSLKKYVIYNPTTKQYRNLLIRRPFTALFLAFDPMKSPHYKVIGLMPKGQSQYSIDVYESETHTWKQWAKRQIIYYWQFQNAVYWNDGFYFIKPRGKSYCFYLQEIEEVVQRIDVHAPPRVCSRGKRIIKSYRMESNGHLHSITLSFQPDKNYLFVFELNKEVRSWFMKYRVDINPIAHLFAVEFLVVGSFLGIVRGDREEDSTFLFHEPGKIILYRFYDSSFEELVDFTTEDYYEKDRVQFDFNDMYQFIETLAPV